MNSVEAAEECIVRNTHYIEWLRGREASFIDFIDDAEKKITELQLSIEKKKNALNDIHREKQIVLVENQALAAFIDNGGGLDMLDEETPKKSGRFHWEED